MSQDQKPFSQRNGVDPLSAMYFIAAILMGLAAVVVIAMMFLPGESVSASGPDVFVPGAEEVDRPTPAPAPSAEAARISEELHQH